MASSLRTVNRVGCTVTWRGSSRATRREAGRVSDTVWITYDELADRLRIGRESARRLVLRKRWAKRKGNDGKVRIGVPGEALSRDDPRYATRLVGRLSWDLVSWWGDPRAPRCPLSRHQKAPLRPLTADERKELTRLSRSLSAPAAEVERARALLAIADGATYTAAAHQVGRRHTETLSAWVSRFNRDGLAAVRPGHGGGARIRYGAAAQQRILAEWARAPQREQDGTATWSLSLLQRALRQAPDGLPEVSTFTIWRSLHE